MREKIEKAVEGLIEKSRRENTSADEALKLTQAALNAVHVIAVLANIDQLKK